MPKLMPGDRVSWTVPRPSHTRLKPALDTFYGTVIRLQNQDMHGCRSCQCGERGAVIQADLYPDSRSWFPERMLTLTDKLAE